MRRRIVIEEFHYCFKYRDNEYDFIDVDYVELLNQMVYTDISELIEEFLIPTKVYAWSDEIFIKIIYNCRVKKIITDNGYIPDYVYVIKNKYIPNTHMLGKIYELWFKIPPTFNSMREYGPIIVEGVDNLDETAYFISSSISIIVNVQFEDKCFKRIVWFLSLEKIKNLVTYWYDDGGHDYKFTNGETINRFLKNKRIMYQNHKVYYKDLEKLPNIARNFMLYEET